MNTGDFQQRWTSSPDPEVQVCNQSTKAPLICITARLEEITETYIHMTSEKQEFNSKNFLMVRYYIVQRLLVLFTVIEFYFFFNRHFLQEHICKLSLWPLGKVLVGHKRHGPCYVRFLYLDVPKFCYRKSHSSLCLSLSSQTGWVI